MPPIPMIRRSVTLGVGRTLFSLSFAACSNGPQRRQRRGQQHSREFLRGRTSGAAKDSMIKIGLLSTLERTIQRILVEAANNGAKVALVEDGGTLDGAGTTTRCPGCNDQTAEGRARRRLLGHPSGPALAAAPPARGEEQGRHPRRTTVRGRGPHSQRTATNSAPTSPSSNGTSGCPEHHLARAHRRLLPLHNRTGRMDGRPRRLRRQGPRLQEGRHPGRGYSFPYNQVGGFMTPFWPRAVGYRTDLDPHRHQGLHVLHLQIPKDTDALYVTLGGADACTSPSSSTSPG